ncbi:MAG TPA: VanW family protein [Firmicutes bacterium]|nr:VanW family protein [Bacillota bacterium]
MSGRNKRSILVVFLVGAFITAFAPVAIAPAPAILPVFRHAPAGPGEAPSWSGQPVGRPVPVARPVVVASFSTVLKEGELTRNGNIRLAAEAIDGTRLAPGAVFSFDAIVGPRIREKGYQAAKVIVEGAAAPGIGGGICQVSTTLYNVALLAGMEILERHHHSRPVDYVPLGRDATVAEGSLDLKFRNPTGETIILRAHVGGNRLLIEALAARPLRRKVEILTSIEEVVQPRVLDAPPPSGYDGFHGSIYSSGYGGVRGGIYGGTRDGTGPPAASGREGYKVSTWRVTRYLSEDEGQGQGQGQEGRGQGQGGPQPETRELISEDYYRPVDVLLGAYEG